MKKMNEKKIQILMATYNGEKYLDEQLESIISQTYKNWEILIRDDGSKDNTISIVEKYKKKYPNKIFLIKDNSNNLGACYNFLKLLEWASSEYIMFSDQDDIWLKNKIEITLNEMIENESVYPNLPIAIHTDLKVIDSDKNIIYDSYYKFIKLDPRKQIKLGHILIRNALTGCTVMINKKLLSLIIPYPNGILMHDLWIYFIANIFGKSIFIDRQTILYRIHDNNTIGIKINTSFNKNIFSFICNFKKNKETFFLDNKVKHEQITLFFETFQNIDENKKLILNDFSNLFQYNFFYKRFLILKNSFFDQDIIKNIRNFLYY